MAENGELQAHEKTYEGFTTMMTWGAGIAFVLAFILVLVVT